MDPTRNHASRLPQLSARFELATVALLAAVMLITRTHSLSNLVHEMLVSSGQFVAGMTGHAKIHTGYQTIGRRLWRMACQTFRFEM